MRPTSSDIRGEFISSPRTTSALMSCCLGQGRLPVGDVASRAKIRVQEMAFGAQHACDFGEETGEVWVGSRGLDIDHRVEGFVGEG